MKFNTLCALMALMLSATIATAQDLLDYVPTDCEVVISVDVADVMAAPVVDELWRSEIDESELGAGVRFLERMTGVNARTDIERIVIAGQIDRDETGFVLVKGQYEEQALVDIVMMNPSYGKVESAGRTVHRWEDNGAEKFGVFLPDGVLLIANTAERLRAVVETGEDKRSSYRDEQADSLPAPAPIWCWIARPERAGVELGDFMQIIQAEQATMRMTMPAGEVVIESTLQPADTALAGDFREALEGLVAIGRVQTASPELAQLARDTAVSAGEGGLPTATTTVDNAMFQTMIRDMANGGF